MTARTTPAGVNTPTSAPQIGGLTLTANPGPVPVVLFGSPAGRLIGATSGPTIPTTLQTWPRGNRGS